MVTYIHESRHALSCDASRPALPALVPGPCPHDIPRASYGFWGAIGGGCQIDFEARIGCKDRRLVEEVFDGDTTVKERKGTPGMSPLHRSSDGLSLCTRRDHVWWLICFSGPSRGCCALLTEKGGKMNGWSRKAETCRRSIFIGKPKKSYQSGL